MEHVKDSGTSRILPGMVFFSGFAIAAFCGRLAGMWQGCVGLILVHDLENLF
jgi:hypothetical protein